MLELAVRSWITTPIIAHSFSPSPSCPFCPFLTYLIFIPFHPPVIIPLFLPLQVKGGKMGLFREKLEAQERFVKMQRELEKAKEQLYKIRKERAKH